MNSKDSKSCWIGSFFAEAAQRSLTESAQEAIGLGAAKNQPQSHMSAVVNFQPKSQKAGMRNPLFFHPKGSAKNCFGLMISGSWLVTQLPGEQVDRPAGPYRAASAASHGQEES